MENFKLSIIVSKPKWTARLEPFQALKNLEKLDAEEGYFRKHFWVCSWSKQGSRWRYNETLILGTGNSTQDQEKNTRKVSEWSLCTRNRSHGVSVEKDGGYRKMTAKEMRGSQDGTREYMCDLDTCTDFVHQSLYKQPCCDTWEPSNECLQYQDTKVPKTEDWGTKTPITKD